MHTQALRRHFLLVRTSSASGSSDISWNSSSLSSSIGSSSASSVCAISTTSSSRKRFRLHVRINRYLPSDLRVTHAPYMLHVQYTGRNGHPWYYKSNNATIRRYTCRHACRLYKRGSRLNHKAKLYGSHCMSA